MGRFNLRSGHSGHAWCSHAAWPTLLAAGLVACSPSREALPQASTFGALVERLSEPGGYFDTDNLISNERSYLHVVDDLVERGLEGGAFIGVGPDQSFSYIAAIRPEVAYILDIRRDNMLEHFIFKALFALSDTRIAYLSGLFGRPTPSDPSAWVARGIDSLVAYVDTISPDGTHVERWRARVDSVIATFGVPLSLDDRATIDRFHRAFIAEGTTLRFQSFGRAPRAYYPTYRDLVLERTRSGRRANFLASRDDFLFVKALQHADRIVPVTGDFAGPHALRAIGRDIRARGLSVSAFYTSNVEFYLYRERTFSTFAENVAALPYDERGVIIRSVFVSSSPYTHPRAVRGYASVQLVQSITRLVDGYRSGAFERYWELVR